MTTPVIDCMQNHRSIRRYKSEPIPDNIIETILGAGTRAATAGNLQLYSFLVVDEPETLALFKTKLSPGIGSPPLIIIALLDLHRVARWLEVNDARPPILDRPVYFMLGLTDALIALQNVVLAAESLGLGTCYYGSILELDIQQHFGTPEHVFPAGMVCMGYPAVERDRTMRLPLEAVVHRNRYRSFDDATIRRLYRDRDAVWDTVSEERKAALGKQGIHSIPQALAIQRFSDEVTGARSRGILDNLRRAGFDLTGDG